MEHKSLLVGLLGRMKQNALAEEIGVTQPTVSRWLKGSKPEYDKMEKIVDLAREHGLIGENVGRDEAMAEVNRPNDVIPEIDVTAGLGGGGLTLLEQGGSSNGMTFSREVVRDHWRLPGWVMARMGAKVSHVAAFPVQGDSMLPTLEDGDVIFVDTRHRVPSPPGIYALADEFGGVVVKRLEVVSRPGAEEVIVSVISDNERHKPRELMLSEMAIIGRYVGRFTV